MIKELATPIIQSQWFKEIEFWLFDMIKKLIPSDYIVTAKDINYLLILDEQIEYDEIYRIWFWRHILSIIDKLSMVEDLYEIHPDPYEIFIECWVISKWLKSLMNEID